MYTEAFSKEDIDKISRWVTCIAVVKFDIDEGQMVEHIFPANILTKQQEKTLAMLAFPDSNSFDGQEGTLKYIFRLKRQTGEYNFGFTCFKQKKDGKQFRGYFQKSLVVLSSIPLIQFYEKLAQFLVFKTFPNNQCAVGQLEKVVKQIVAWPDCTREANNKIVELNVLGYEFKVEMPGQNDIGSPRCLFKQLPCYFQDSCLYEPYKQTINQLWSVWEIALLNRPLLILSDKPHNVCHAVLSAIGLISPLQYAGHYKTYLTVYDPDFPLIQKEVESGTVRQMIIGATNPLFLKVLKNFPCILNLEQPNKNKLKTLTRADKDFCKLLMDSLSEQKMMINQTLLRKYFNRLTRCFMDRFEEYFMMQQNVMCKLTQDLKRFDKVQFLKFVKKQEVAFPSCYDSKSDLTKLYEDFCQSSNFKNYLTLKNVIRFQ